MAMSVFRALLKILLESRELLPHIKIPLTGRRKGTHFMLVVTALTASALGLLTIVLSFRVIGLRRSQKVSVGDGDNEELLRAIRSHSNLLEYAPLTLILLGAAEINGVSSWLLGAIAVAFVAGRALHPTGMSKAGSGRNRVLGMQLTLTSIIALCLVNVVWVVYLLIR